RVILLGFVSLLLNSVLVSLLSLVCLFIYTHTLSLSYTHSLSHTHTHSLSISLSFLPRLSRLCPQAVISLHGCLDGRAVPFSAKLHLRGKEAGSVRGEVQLVPAEPQQDKRRGPAAASTPGAAPGAAASGADERCGYLLKQGAQRKNWKRRWFECRCSLSLSLSRAI